MISFGCNWYSFSFSNSFHFFELKTICSKPCVGVFYRRKEIRSAKDACWGRFSGQEAGQRKHRDLPFLNLHGNTKSQFRWKRNRQGWFVKKGKNVWVMISRVYLFQKNFFWFKRSWESLGTSWLRKRRRWLKRFEMHNFIFFFAPHLINWSQTIKTALKNNRKRTKGVSNGAFKR